LGTNEIIFPLKKINHLKLETELLLFIQKGLWNNINIFLSLKDPLHSSLRNINKIRKNNDF